MMVFHGVSNISNNDLNIMSFERVAFHHPKDTEESN